MRLTRDELVAQQTAIVAKLERERAECIEAGNEYHAKVIEAELEIAKSLSRLIHKQK